MSTEKDKPYKMYTTTILGLITYYILDETNNLLYTQLEGCPWEKQLGNNHGSGVYVKHYHQFVRYMSEEELFLELL